MQSHGRVVGPCFAQPLSRTLAGILGAPIEPWRGDVARVADDAKPHGEDDVVAPFANHVAREPFALSAPLLTPA